MQLIVILLITVSILTVLSGATVFFGAKKGERLKSFWFFVATIFAAIWIVSICIFLRAAPNSTFNMAWHTNWTFVSAIFIDIALLAYISWQEKFGKLITAFFFILGLVLTGIFVNNPALLYTDIILANSGNSLVTNVGPFYFAYAGFFCLLVPAVMLTLLKQIITSSSFKKRGGDLVLLIGFGISGTMSLIFNLILTFWRWDLIWLGPLAISTTIIAFYYSILRYRVLNLYSTWLKVLSYIVIITSLAVVYMVIFSIVFAAMFRGATPSTEVIVLNFIMILIVLLLLPATNELNMFIRSLISNQKIDTVYIVKKLVKASPKQTSLNELASFLAEHMHFKYIGFLIDNQIYGSTPREFTANEVKMVSKLGKPENGVWQKVDEASPEWQHLDLSAVAVLRDVNDKTFGQIMLGKPIGKTNFNRQDLVQIETILNIVSVIVDSKKHSNER
ncbi:hypothetical protein IJH24_00125 [Candidatus Saccharibacteria bacterium]|nr:hypothetical protein [Candidatus Saccharibacteria bacterium]